MNIKQFQKNFRKFVKARNWEQFHTPKNLSMALSVEASELVEIFQWLTAEDSKPENLSKVQMGQISDEVADIFIYLSRICDVLDIDLEDAVKDKMLKNGKKYPPGEIKLG